MLKLIVIRCWRVWSWYIVYPIRLHRLVRRVLDKSANVVRRVLDVLVVMPSSHTCRRCIR